MNKKIYYNPLHFQDTEIKIENIENHSEYSYSDCPVWKHRYNRTFVGYSPCNFSLGITDDLVWYEVNGEERVEVFIDDFIDEAYIDDYILIDGSDIDNDFPVIQLKFPGVYIFTNFENEYLWFEMLDHPETSLHNNFVGIGGWWNLANHPRTIVLACKMQNRDEILYIEKGDPIYRIRFYSENMDNKYSLMKKNDDFDVELMNNRREILFDDPKFRNDILFDKDVRKQCPFHKS